MGLKKVRQQHILSEQSKDGGKKIEDNVMEESKLVRLSSIEKTENLKKEVSRNKSNKRLKEKERIKNRLTSYNFKYFDNVNCYKIFKEGESKKAVAEVYPRTKHIEVRVKTPSPVHLEYKEGYKYYLPIHYFIAYEHIDYLDIMETLLKSYL